MQAFSQHLHWQLLGPCKGKHKLLSKKCASEHTLKIRFYSETTLKTVSAKKNLAFLVCWHVFNCFSPNQTVPLVRRHNVSLRWGRHLHVGVAGKGSAMGDAVGWKPRLSVWHYHSLHVLLTVKAASYQMNKI